MPRRASPPHPATDPFPHLPIIRTISVPTYASVAASARPRPSDPMNLNHSWGAEDVDRSERLDELNFYATAAPPWRREESTATAALGDAEADRSTPARTEPTVTLDELLGSWNESMIAHARAILPNPVAPQTVTSGAHRHYANPFSLPGYQDVWPTMESRREINGSWDGAIDAARRRGYVPTPPGGQPRMGIPPPPIPHSDPPTGRYRGPPVYTENTFSVDPDEAAPGQDDLEVEEDDEETHPWVVRSVTSRGRLYQHENMTGDDLDGWGRSEGVGSGSLLRGGNNRRRRSMVERREVGQEREDERVGLEPTNVDTTRGSVPLVVRSTGVRRHREQHEEEVIAGLANKLKRRKLEADKAIGQPIYPTRPAYLSFSTLASSTPLPFGFLPPTRSSRLALTVRHSPSHSPRQVITFTLIPTPRHTDADAASLRTFAPIPIGCGIHYYEAEVFDQGEEGFMSVGWMKAGVELGRLVGWDKGSWGWHGDDGMSFEGQGTGEEFGDKWGTGDTVGCGIDFTTGRAFFTKNGKFIGYRFKNLSSGLHPAIGLRTPRESIAVNFTGPFVFDIDAYVRKVRDQAWAEATVVKEVLVVPRLCDQPAQGGASRRKQLDESDAAGDPGTSDLPKISPLHAAGNKANAAFVLDYLAHNGYDSSLRMVRDSMIRRNWLPPRSESSSPIETESTPSPTRLADFPSAAAALVHLHSQLLERTTHTIPWDLIHSLLPSQRHLPESLAHHLQIQEFIRLLRKADDLPEAEAEEVDREAIDLGKTLLGRSKEESWPAGDRKLLDQAFGLLGIPVSDWNVGTGSVAGEQRRKADADELVSSIRHMRGMKARSFLEQGMRQSVLVGRRLGEMDGKAGLMDVRRVWERSGDLVARKDTS